MVAAGGGAMATPNRRQVLLGSTAILVTACQPGAAVLDGDTGLEDTGEPGPLAPEVAFEPDALSQDDAQFPLTVQAGAMREDSALLVTSCATPGDLLLRVWQPLSDGMVAMWVDELVATDADGFIRVQVAGLRAGEWYAYAFFPLDGEGEPVSRSLIGRFRTALPSGSREPITIATSACNGSGNRPWPAMERMANEDIDLICHLGDMAYNDGAQSLAEYRASWREYLTGSGFRAAYAHAGLYAVWDDHEFDNDWDPETMPPQQIAAAKQSFFEHIAAEQAADGTSWTSYRWGATAEFFVLDCRSERKPSGRTEPTAEYVSHAQLQWLIESIAASPCHFKVILNSVPITDMPLLWDIASADRWEGYAAQRTALLEALDEASRANVWFLSGDFHVCFVSTLANNPSSQSGRIHEIAVTGGNSNLLGDSLTFGSDQFLYGTSQARTCTVRFDPEADEVRVRFLDPDSGEVDWEQTLSYSNR
jgi:phosphodiesterase/alkaline phosphatase D-like protein